MSEKEKNIQLETRLPKIPKKIKQAIYLIYLWSVVGLIELVLLEKITNNILSDAKVLIFMVASIIVIIGFPIFISHDFRINPIIGFLPPSFQNVFSIKNVKTRKNLVKTKA